MCEANAYMIKTDKEELIMEGVDVVEPRGNQIYLRSIFGDQKILNARLKTTSLLEHKIVLEAVKDE
jgi:predicted RNA-binding protein